MAPPDDGKDPPGKRKPSEVRAERKAKMVDGITYVTRDEVSKKPIFVRKPYDKPPINPLKCLLDRLPRSLPESAPEVVASGETRRPTLLQTCQHLRRDWRASRSLAYDPKEWIPSSKSPTPGRATQTSRRGSSSTASTLIGSTSATLSSTSSYVTASRGSDPPPSSSSRHRHFKSVTATLPNFGRDERQSWASAHLRDHASNKTPPRGEAKASSPISPPHGHHKSEVKSTPTQTNLEKVPVSTTVDHTRAWVESVSDLATKGTSKTASTRTKADMPKENLRSSSSRTTSDDKKRSNGRSAETTTSSPATPNPPPFVPTAPPPPPYHVAALHPGMPGMTSMAVPMMGMPPMGIHPMGYPPMPPMTQPFFPPPWPYGPPGHNMDSIPSSVRDEPPPARTTTTRSGSTRHDSSSRPASSSERTPTTERTASSRDPRPSGHSSSKHSSSSRDKPAAEHASSSRRGSPSRHSRPSSRHESSSTRPTSPPRHTSPTDQASSTSRSSDKSEMSKAVDTSSSAAAADRTSSSTSSCTRQSSSRSRSRPKTYICAGCGKIRSSSYHHRLWMGVDRKAMSCYCGKCVDKATSSEGETEKKARRKKRKAREAREESQRDHEHRSCNSRQDVRDSSPSSTSSDDTIVDVRRVDSTRRKSHSSHRRCGSHGAQAGPSSDSRGGRGSRDNHSQSTSGGISGSSTHNHDATNWGGSPSEIPVSTSGSHWDPNLNDHHPTDSSHRQGPRQASDYHPRVGTEFERAAAEHRMATHPLPFRHVYTEDADETSSEDQAVRVDLPPMQRRGLLLQGNPSSSDGHQIVRHHSRRGESGHRDVMNRAVDLDEVDRSARRGHDRGGMYDGDSHSRAHHRMQPRGRIPYDDDQSPRSRRSSARHPANLYDDGDGDDETDDDQVNDDGEITRRMGTVGLTTTTFLRPDLPPVYRISTGSHHQHDYQRHGQHDHQQHRQSSLLLPASSISSTSSAQSSTRGEYGSSLSSRRDGRTNNATNATTATSGGGRHGRTSHQRDDEERRENDDHQTKKKGFRVRWSD